MASDDLDDMDTGHTETDPPRDIRIEQNVRDLYRELQEDEASPFTGARLLDIFLTAAAVGSYEGLRQPLDGKTVGLFNVSSLSQRHKTTIRSIAWRETREEEIYHHQERAFQITMEFANGGIHRLHTTRLGLGDTVTETVTDYVQRWHDIEAKLEDRSIIDSE